MNLFRFLFSKAFLKNLVIAVIIALIIILGSLIALKFYTDHGEALSVPDLSGLTTQEAKEQLEELNLKAVIADSIFLSEYEPGTVIDQLPVAGFKVKEERSIFLTINAMTPDLVAMPNVTGVSFRQAQVIIESFGLTVGKLIYKPYIAKNYVLEQSIRGNEVAPGDSVYKGAEVDLVLGNGLSDVNTYVPKLHGLHEEKAEQLITDAYLNVGAVIYDNTVLDEEDSLNAIIFRQSPLYHEGLRLPMGSFIDIWMTVDSLKVFDEPTLEEEDAI